MKKLLWIADAACPSGFARATHEILDTVRHDYDVTVLGINYRGDPHLLPYPVYAAAVEGDSIGVGRLIWMCDRTKPDAIVIQQDGWNIPYYTNRLASKKDDGSQWFPEHAGLPVVGIVPIDGKNFQGDWLKGLTHAIFWTDFARKEARKGGFTGPSSVIPLGVDTNIYYPMDKSEARLLRGLPRELDDAFIVGNVNRNQPRKRWDLTIKYFAEWIKKSRIDNAYLYLHTAPTGDSGPNVSQLATYYGIGTRLVLVQPATFYGITEQKMRETYNCFDVQVSTTQGEGFGLTTAEGMACGIPQIVPEWSALGEWTKDAAVLVPCTSTAINPVAPGLNIIGGVADEKRFIEVLDHLYRQDDWRRQYSEAGLTRIKEDRFRWSTIGERYVDVLNTLLGTRAEEISFEKARMTFKGVLHGVEQMRAKLREFANRHPDRVAAALYQEAQIIMTESKRRCPVAPGGGTLRASGMVQFPERSGRNISVTLSYGGAADEYAIAVHETPSAYDPPSWKAMYAAGGEIQWTSAGTGPKFLEGPINEAAADMEIRLGERIHFDKGVT